MTETVNSTASCLASIVNGPNGKLTIVCGTVVILYGISAAWYLIANGHSLTVANEKTKVVAA